MAEEVIKECEFYLPLSEKCNEILDSNGNEIYKCSSRQDCCYKQLKRLEQENKELKHYLACMTEQRNKAQTENERLKVQYNCYACGNCKGKEDYINLEKHHKGLRKQFEKYYQQTLDDEIQINELMQENERLKEEILKWQKAYSRQYQINENKGYNKKEEQYRQTLQEIKKYSTEMRELANDDVAYHYFGTVLSIITKAEEE